MIMIMIIIKILNFSYKKYFIVFFNFVIIFAYLLKKSNNR